MEGKWNAGWIRTRTGLDDLECMDMGRLRREKTREGERISSESKTQNEMFLQRGVAFKPRTDKTRHII